MKRYEVRDHTADIGLTAYGRDLKELFCNAAFGMFDIIGGLENVEPLEEFSVEEKAPNVEELLVAWLREFLYQHHTKEILFKEFSIEDLSDGHVKGVGRGEKIDRARHELKREVKAVTYHELKVWKAGRKWQGQLIFDT